MQAQRPLPRRARIFQVDHHAAEAYAAQRRTTAPEALAPRGPRGEMEEGGGGEGGKERAGTHLLCNTPRMTSRWRPGNIPVRMAISASPGALTVPAPGRAPLASSDIHWRTTPPLPAAGPVSCASSAALEAPFGAGAAGIGGRAVGVRRGRGTRAVVTTSSGSIAAAWRRASA